MPNTSSSNRRIQDIIDAATPGPWKWKGDISRQEMYSLDAGASYALMVGSRPVGYDGCDHYIEDSAWGRDKTEGPNMTFIATFDPEHVALMEAVVEALVNETASVTIPLGNLLAYRKVNKY